MWTDDSVPESNVVHTIPRNLRREQKVQEIFFSEKKKVEREVGIIELEWKEASRLKSFERGLALIPDVYATTPFGKYEVIGTIELLSPNLVAWELRFNDEIISTNLNSKETTQALAMSDFRHRVKKCFAYTA